MCRITSLAGLAFVVAAAAAAASASPVRAHGADADYESQVTRVVPPMEGLAVSVPGGGSHVKVVNRTGRTVVILGYDGEPLARLLPDGTVQENRNSPSFWLNKDEQGNAPVPPGVERASKPDWRVVNSSGSLEWHDHRVHWMGGAPPAKVRDRSSRAFVLRWQVPISVDGRGVDVEGGLWWRGRPGPGSRLVLSAFAALAACGLVLAAVVLRRRRSFRDEREEP